jgi:hypothetical protein
VHGADRDGARGEVAVVERGGDQVALAQRRGELLDPAVAAGERREIGRGEAGGELGGEPVDGGGELVAAIGEAREGRLGPGQEAAGAAARGGAAVEIVARARRGSGRPGRGSARWCGS